MWSLVLQAGCKAPLLLSFLLISIKSPNAQTQQFLFWESSTCCRKEHILGGKVMSENLCIEKWEGLVVNLTTPEPQMPTLPLSTCAILGRLLKLSAPGFSPEHGDDSKKLQFPED